MHPLELHPGRCCLCTRAANTAPVPPTTPLASQFVVPCQVHVIQNQTFRPTRSHICANGWQRSRKLCIRWGYILGGGAFTLMPPSNNAVCLCIVSCKMHVVEDQALRLTRSQISANGWQRSHELCIRSSSVLGDTAFVRHAHTLCVLADTQRVCMSTHCVLWRTHTVYTRHTHRVSTTHRCWRNPIELGVQINNIPIKIPFK